MSSEWVSSRYISRSRHLPHLNFTCCPLTTKMSFKFIQRIRCYRLLKISKDSIKIFPCKYGCCRRQNDGIVVFFPKKIFSKSSAKTSYMTGSSAAMFLIDTYPDPGPLASETSHQMIRFNPLRFLSAKKCSSICPEKATENSIQMVSAPGHA